MPVYFIFFSLTKDLLCISENLTFLTILFLRNNKEIIIVYNQIVSFHLTLILSEKFLISHNISVLAWSKS